MSGFSLIVALVIAALGAFALGAYAATRWMK